MLPDEVVQDLFSRWRTTTSRDYTLTVAFRGRLGNNMFEYASLLGIAVSTGKQPLIPKSIELNILFNISFIGDMRNQSSTRVLERQYGAYDRKLLTLPGGNVEVLGYLQSWKYFHCIRASIRKEFMFRQKYIDLSATDDKNWCRKYVVSSDIILMENSDPFVDFATLTLCDHMIMTVGTFGWWAAWLGDGHAVYYRDFPRPGSGLDRDLIKEDHFLPHWVPLGA
ncbi:galactoside alpha-(1,2)-fucosyltransferase 2-like [Haliotis rubra]|uniref:galactoside alpha-(1,2)-fucosyltransferase 2-like n=1 Tax=Haliotis rubra TaxID=36100 RepID=UPI001EE5D659|nr:galactoside alpha-(1,2)-fucosyltransferase 2-like [Haliotis rubra]